MLLETISCVSRCCAEGRVSVTVKSSARHAVAKLVVVAVSQFQFQKFPREPVFNCECNSALIARRNSVGAVKKSASCFSDFFKFCASRHASAHAGQSWICFFQFQNCCGVQFTVGVGIDERSGLLTIHFWPPGLNSPASCFCNCFRARARRDITVPMGTSDSSAISL